MNAVLALIVKDLSIEFRRKESVVSMMMFGLLVLVVFNFAFEAGLTDGVERFSIGPGILWVAISFAGILGLNRALAIDLDNDSLQGLLLAPLSRSGLYVGKVLSNFVFMLFADLVILVLFIVFYDLEPGARLLWIGLVVLLGSFGFATVGTILSMVSSHTRMSEVMLPVLLIPITLPLIIAAVEATASVLGEAGSTPGPWMNLVIGFDIIFFVISYLIFDYVVEE